jgi:hypothetical protein
MKVLKLLFEVIIFVTIILVFCGTSISLFTHYPEVKKEPRLMSDKYGCKTFIGYEMGQRTITKTCEDTK